MNEMLERMARAAYEQFNIGVESLEPSWDKCPEDFKFRMMEAQKAALKEIREPTAGMIIDGTQSYPGYKISIAAVERCWHAMIDVIIRDQ